MLKAVQAWVRNYYYISMGLPIPEVFPESDEYYEREYQKYFKRPIDAIVTGGKGEADKEAMNRVVSTLSLSKVKQWPHLLQEWLDVDFRFTGDLSKDLFDCIQTFLGRTMLCSAGTINGNDFDVYLRKEDNELLGTYPSEFVVYGDVNEFPLGGNNLKKIMEKDPFTLKDEEVYIIRFANDLHDFGDITKYLKSSIRCIPIKGSFDTVPITALTEELPPYSVRNLISNLPFATIQECNNNPYLALMSIVDCNPSAYDQEVKDYLSNLFGGSTNNAFSDLNDDVVLDYLNQKFGANYTSLSAAVKPSLQDIAKNAISVSGDIANMSAEEFAQVLCEDPDCVTDTLDNIIKNYCEEEHVSLDCTIGQLLQALDDEIRPVPKTFVEIVANYMSANQISGDVTLHEVITGTKPVNEISVQDAINTLVKNDVIDKITLNKLNECYENRQKLHWPDINQTIRNFINKSNLPDNIQQPLLESINTGKPAVFDKQTQLDEAVELVKASGYTVNEPADLSLDDRGYSAANVILYNFRKKLSDNDNNELRTQMLPMLYSFSRVLMLKKGDEEDAIEFLDNKKLECSDEIAQVIDLAIDELKG